MAKSSDNKSLFILRLLFIAAGVSWGVSLFGVVLPWGFVQGQLAELGAGQIDDVMVKYWLKMAASVYGLMGLFFVMVAFWPMRFRSLIGPVGWFHLIAGAVILVNGLMLGVEAIPLYVDVGFCFFVGVGIVLVNRRVVFVV